MSSRAQWEKSFLQSVLGGSASSWSDVPPEGDVRQPHLAPLHLGEKVWRSRTATAQHAQRIKPIKPDKTLISFTIKVKTPLIHFIKTALVVCSSVRPPLCPPHYGTCGLQRKHSGKSVFIVFTDTVGVARCSSAWGPGSVPSAEPRTLASLKTSTSSRKDQVTSATTETPEHTKSP